MKMNLVGTGTSVRSPNMLASCSLINADRGFSRTFSSPTRMLEASAPAGIFFIKCAFWNNNHKISKLSKWIWNWPWVTHGPISCFLCIMFDRKFIVVVNILNIYAVFFNRTIIIEMELHNRVTLQVFFSWQLMLKNNILKKSCWKTKSDKCG